MNSTTKHLRPYQVRFVTHVCRTTDRLVGPGRQLLSGHCWCDDLLAPSDLPIPSADALLYAAMVYEGCRLVEAARMPQDRLPWNTFAEVNGPRATIPGGSAAGGIARPDRSSPSGFVKKQL
jgi:hypothetical protein